MSRLFRGGTKVSSESSSSSSCNAKLLCSISEIVGFVTVALNCLLPGLTRCLSGWTSCSQRAKLSILLSECTGVRSDSSQRLWKGVQDGGGVEQEVDRAEET